jgi:Domain of Unknown Function with PDB structure (DUF3857)
VGLHRLSSISIPVLFAFLVSYSTIVYGVDFQPVSQEELKMTSEPLAPGAPAVILFRQLERNDDRDTAHEDNYFRIKILTEQGRKYADVEIPIYRDVGKIVNIHARSIRPDGSITNFDGKVFEKPLVKARGLKYMAKVFTIPDIQIGSIIEYYYTIDFRFVSSSSHWIMSQELFTKSARFSLKPYQNSYNPYSLRWTWQGLPPGTDQPRQGPDRIVRLEANNIPAFQPEDYMPPENELKARVDFFYSDEPFEQDSTKFWMRVGKKFNDQVDKFIDKRKAMEKAVSEIIAPTDAPAVKLQKIYARVQQLRNTTYEVEKTEQEQKREHVKEAANVEDIWKNGYGDRFQLTWLFLALARAAGFEAYSVAVSDRNNYFFYHSLSFDPNKFTSAVVLVKLNGNDIYCDPGAAFTPFGLLPWEETGVEGLRLDKNGGIWIQTTLPESSSSRIQRAAHLALSETGDLEGNLTVTFSGLEAVRRRVEERDRDEADRKRCLEEQAREYVPAAIEIELTTQPDWKSSSTPLVAEFHLKIPGWVAGSGRRAMLPVGIFSATEKNVFEHANRVYPIYFEFPFEKDDDITISLPLGWVVGSVPKIASVDKDPVIYTLKIDKADNALHITRKLSVDMLLLGTKYYPALRNFFQAVRTGDDEQVVLEPVGATARN